MLFGKFLPKFHKLSAHEQGFPLTLYFKSTEHCLRRLNVRVLSPERSSIFYMACILGSASGIIGMPIQFRVPVMVYYWLPILPTIGCQFCRQTRGWAKLPTRGK